MNDFTKAWLVMICITLMFFMAQKAVLKENPDATVFISYDDQLGNVNDNYTQQDFTTGLPKQNSVDTDNTNIFNDPYRVIWGWVISIPGAKYVTGTVSAPYKIMTSIGVPKEYAGYLTAIWFLLIVLLTLMMIVWRG